MSHNYIAMFTAGEAVYYNGEKLKQELTAKDGKPYKGWIHAPVMNEENAFVVFFPDTKDQDSYVLSGVNLTKARPPRIDKIQTGPIIEHMPTRRRKGEEE